MLAYIKRKWWIAAFAVFLALHVALLALLYIYVIHQLLGTPFMKFEQHRGLEHYTTGEYLEFEKGPLFQEMLSSYEFLDECRVIDFYYCDNRYKDSLVYGKRPDVYGVMLDSGKDYEEIKARIMAEGIHDSTMSPWNLEKARDVYLMPQYNDGSIELVFIVGRDIEYLSFIMVTEILKEGQTRAFSSILDVILRWSALPFDLDERLVVTENAIHNARSMEAIQHLGSCK